MSRINVVICLLTVFLAANPSFAGDRPVKDSDLRAVYPEASSFEPVKNNVDIVYYKAKDSSGCLLGVVFKACGEGYHGSIETLTGMLKDGTITAIKVLSENESPGPGALIKGAKFTDQFKYKKDLSGVQAITGATVSSQAVIDSVKKKAAEIKVILDKE